MEDIVVKNGLMQKLFKDVMQQLLEAEMEELYGIDVSPSMISKITDKIVEAAAEWQSRTLDEIYPIVSKASYICMALDMKEKRYIRYLDT